MFGHKEFCDNLWSYIKSNLEKFCHDVMEGEMQLKDLGEWCCKMDKFIELYDGLELWETFDKD